MQTMEEEEKALGDLKLFASDALQDIEPGIANFSIVTVDVLNVLSGRSKNFKPGDLKPMLNFAFSTIKRENAKYLFETLKNFIDSFFNTAQPYFRITNRETAFLTLSRDKLFEKENADFKNAVNLFETFYFIYNFLEEADKNNLVKTVEKLKFLEKAYQKTNNGPGKEKDYLKLFDEHKKFLLS